MEDLPEVDIQIISLVMAKDGGVLLADFAHEYELLYKGKVCGLATIAIYSHRI